MFESIKLRYVFLTPAVSTVKSLSAFWSCSPGFSAAPAARFLPAALLRKSARGESEIFSAGLIHSRMKVGAFIALHFAERASLPETWITAPPPLKAKFPTSLIFLMFSHPSGRRFSQRRAGCHCSRDKSQNAASLSSQVSALCVDGRLSLNGAQRWSDGATIPAAKTEFRLNSYAKKPPQKPVQSVNVQPVTELLT